MTLHFSFCSNCRGMTNQRSGTTLNSDHGVNYFQCPWPLKVPWLYGIDHIIVRDSTLASSYFLLVSRALSMFQVDPTRVLLSKQSGHPRPQHGIHGGCHPTAGGIGLSRTLQCRDWGRFGIVPGRGRTACGFWKWVDV